MSVSWQRKIMHMDEMSEQDFSEFADPEAGYEVSEKMDGQNLSFGIDSGGKFFTKTKRSQPVYDAEFYDGVPYLSGFQDFHRAAERKAGRFLKDVWREWPVHGTIQLFAELLPYPHTNTIIYDDSGFGSKGAVVLFNFKDSEGNRSGHILESFADALNQNVYGFEIYSKPVIDYSFADALRGRSGNVAEFKRRVIQDIDANYTSLLGADKPEGYMVRRRDTGDIIKLVDKTQFTEANKENHRVSNDVQSANRNLKVNIRQQVFGNADVLTNWDKAKDKLADELMVRKQNGKGKFQDKAEALQVLVADMESEGHVPSPSQAKAVASREFSGYFNRLQSVQEDFKSRADEQISQIARDVARHKLENSRKRFRDAYSRFLDGDITALVEVALGPTRVGRVTNQFVA